ncbi:MAG TPA: CHAD domain-containing protein [Xanthomonadaceae bacterium]|nr:CHAD domain-containing protein [Xanthomonadaceae bacterium]
MPPGIRARPHFGRLLAAFVAAELKRAGRMLARSGQRRHVGIHQGRKSLRRARAALALGGPALQPAAAVQDRAIRTICRSLSRERDAHAVIDTLKTLADGHGEVSARELKRTADLLRERRDTILATRLARDPDLARLRTHLARIAERCARLPWDRVEASHVHDALARSLRRCAAAERRALRDLLRDPEPLHRWRRRLRRLRQQIFALEKQTGLDWREYAATPDPADALSEAQDRSVLAAILRRLKGLDRDTRRRLLAACRGY